MGKGGAEREEGIKASEGIVFLEDDGLMAAPTGLTGGVIPPNGRV